MALLVEPRVGNGFYVPPRERFAHKLLRHVLNHTHQITPADLKRSALFISPHPDDETLGCGGTIVRKAQAGARLKLVYLTDGSAATHANLISSQELKLIRHTEAINAVETLGVDSSVVRFLDLQDGALNRSKQIATEWLAELIREHEPDEVFIPFLHEPFYPNSGDHVAAAQAALEALNRVRKPVIVWQYPIWFWFHWPWVRISPDGIMSRGAVMKNSVTHLFGLRAFKDLRHFVDIESVLDRKRLALAQHGSQMEQIIPDPRWLTLGQIAQGEWLRCFLTGREYFCRSEFKP